jgi:hypothetical protein
MMQSRATDQIARRDYHFLVAAAVLPDGSPSTNGAFRTAELHQYFVIGASG